MTIRVLFQRRSGASASFAYVVLRKFAGVEVSPYAGGGLSCFDLRMMEGLLVKAITPKSLGGLLVDRDRLNAHPGRSPSGFLPGSNKVAKLAEDEIASAVFCCDRIFTRLRQQN
ncbi:hypothetical protein TNCV_2269781 [Trichonephila clavipes]|nr:hypothetical protein TNCV_2269781 [Trichonephila clavipes]